MFFIPLMVAALLIGLFNPSVWFV